MVKITRVQYLLSFDKNLKQIVKEKALECGMKESRLIEDCVCKCLKVELNFIETRGRKPKESKESVVKEKRLKFKKKVSKNIFDWIFKERRTTKADINTIFDYLKALRKEEEFLEEEDKEWLTEMMLCLKGRNFDKLPLKLSELKDKNIMGMLHRRGIPQESINAIFDLIHDKIKPKITTYQKYSFDRTD